METLAVFHILKNGGTTLVDRYKHNSGFAYQRVENEIVLNYQQPNQYKLLVNDCQEQKLKLIFGHGVNFTWNNRLQNSVKYATILRDPVARIISAYNYFRLEMITVHNHITDIDFTTWIINCDKMFPTPVYAQYQQFSKQTHLRTDYGRKIDIWRELDLYTEAIENVEQLSYVFFMEDNYLKHFDTVAQSYDVLPDTSVTHQHSTKSSLASHGLEYLTYEQLNNTELQLLNETVEKDIDFYNHCKEQFE